MDKLNELKKIIDKNDVISFDVFDTLLFRNVSDPKDIFKILSNEVKKIYDINNFFDMRVSAEANARTEKNNFECTLDEIYRLINIPDKKVKDEIKNLELNLEEKFLVFNPFMKEIFEYCILKNKKIICITDMYLPKSFLENKLCNEGYGKLEIFLSCDLRKNKITGSLFEYVYKEKKFNKNKWLHIGDNTNSDYTQPINFGINAYNYEKIPNDINNNNSIINKIINNYLYSGLIVDYWNKLGIEKVSQYYYSLYNWIKDKNIQVIVNDEYSEKLLKKLSICYKKSKRNCNFEIKKTKTYFYVKFNDDIFIETKKNIGILSYPFDFDLNNDNFNKSIESGLIVYNQLRKYDDFYVGKIQCNTFQNFVKEKKYDDVKEFFNEKKCDFVIDINNELNKKRIFNNNNWHMAFFKNNLTENKYNKLKRKMLFNYRIINIFKRK